MWLSERFWESALPCPQVAAFRHFVLISFKKFLLDAKTPAHAAVWTGSVSLFSHQPIRLGGHQPVKLRVLWKAVLERHNNPGAMDEPAPAATLVM